MQCQIETDTLIALLSTKNITAIFALSHYYPLPPTRDDNQQATTILICKTEIEREWARLHEFEQGGSEKRRVTKNRKETNKSIRK